jgi:hypothetical protein
MFFSPRDLSHHSSQNMELPQGSPPFSYKRLGFFLLGKSTLGTLSHTQMKTCSNWPALGLLLSCLSTTKQLEVPPGLTLLLSLLIYGIAKIQTQKTCKFLKGRRRSPFGWVGGSNEPPQKTCKNLKG